MVISFLRFDDPHFARMLIRNKNLGVSLVHLESEKLQDFQKKGCRVPLGQLKKKEFQVTDTVCNALFKLRESGVAFRGIVFFCLSLNPGYLAPFVHYTCSSYQRISARIVSNNSHQNSFLKVFFFSLSTVPKKAKV